MGRMLPYTMPNQRHSLIAAESFVEKRIDCIAVGSSSILRHRTLSQTNDTNHITIESSVGAQNDCIVAV